MAKKLDKNSNKKSEKKTNETSKKNSSKGKKDSLRVRAKYFSVLLLILLLGIIFYLSYVNFVLFPDESNSPNISSECSVDEDCVRVQTSCCPCSMGGTEVCVPEEQADEYRVNKSECPENQFCTAMYNCNEDPCVCEQGNCGFSNSSE